jgi:hypothetical protein
MEPLAGPETYKPLSMPFTNPTLAPSVLAAIGQTPLIELSRPTKNLPGRVLAKAKFLNPVVMLVR